MITYLYSFDKFMESNTEIYGKAHGIGCQNYFEYCVNPER